MLHLESVPPVRFLLQFGKVLLHPFVMERPQGCCELLINVRNPCIPATAVLTDASCICPCSSRCLDCSKQSKLLKSCSVLTTAPPNCKIVQACLTAIGPFVQRPSQPHKEDAGPCRFSKEPGRHSTLSVHEILSSQYHLIWPKQPGLMMENSWYLGSWIRCPVTADIADQGRKSPDAAQTCISKACMHACVHASVRAYGCVHMACSHTGAPSECDPRRSRGGWGGGGGRGGGVRLTDGRHDLLQKSWQLSLADLGQ